MRIFLFLYKKELRNKNTYIYLLIFAKRNRGRINQKVGKLPTMVEGKNKPTNQDTVQ